MQTKEIKILIYEYKNISDLSADDRELVGAAQKISSKAYAPYSGFKVGAALRMADGSIITSNNQENASSPAGLCAERTALFWANANFPDLPVVSIAISAIDKNGNPAKNLSPCGSCRQVMLETEHRFNQPIRLILDSNSKIEVLDNIEGLLPMSFNGSSL